MPHSDKSQSIKNAANFLDCTETDLTNQSHVVIDFISRFDALFKATKTLTNDPVIAALADTGEYLCVDVFDSLCAFMDAPD
jgi:hypothetical protein